MNRYEIRCTPEQAKKALELGAPIKIECFSTATEDHWHEVIPTAEQMISWLEEQGLFIEINTHRPDRICADWSKTIYTFSVVDKFMVIHKHGGYTRTVHYPSRKEATIVAIDAALEYLTQNKE